MLCRDERSASYAADAYARLTFRPSVCESPSGQGAFYTVPGIAEANASAIPIIALTSSTDLGREGKGTITEFDQNFLYQPITKWTTFIKKSESVPEIMRRAFRVATSGRPGTVHVALPQDVMAQEAGVTARDIYAEAECLGYPAFAQRPPHAAVRRAVEFLRAAHRPVLVAGGGVVSSQAHEELTALAELLSAPVGTTITGKGAIREDHALSLGVVGDGGCRMYANAILADADLVFYIGCKAGSVATVNWTLPDPAADPVILHLDIDPLMIGNNYRTAVGLAGDAKLVLADLVGELSAHDVVARPDVPADLARLKARFTDDWLGVQDDGKTPVDPRSVMAALTRVLPADAVVVADPGTATHYTSAYYELRRPGRHFLVPRAFGGLGYAIPASIGAKLACPDQTVIALSGDGSFGMCAGELETIVRLGLPIVIVNFTNSTFGWVKGLQHLHRRSPEDRYLGVDFSTLDHGAIARAFGFAGMKVDRAADMEDALRAAVASGRPTLIDVPTPSEEEVLPPVMSWRALLEKQAEIAGSPRGWVPPVSGV